MPWYDRIHWGRLGALVMAIMWAVTLPSGGWSNGFFFAATFWWWNLPASFLSEREAK